MISKSLTLLLVGLISFGLVTDKAQAAQMDDRVHQVEASRADKFNNTDTSVFSDELRYKIINSRAAILYLTDILPEKGNPYYHMASYGAQSTLVAFKQSQKYNGPEMGQRNVWLPLDDGKNFKSSDLKKKSLNAVFDYFAQFVATADVMETLIYPVLKASPLIPSISESVSPEAAAKFRRAFGAPDATGDFLRFADNKDGDEINVNGNDIDHIDDKEIMDYVTSQPNQKGLIQFIRDSYKPLYEANPILVEKLEITQKKVVLSIMASLAGAMEVHMDHAKIDDSGRDRENELQEFFDNVKALGKLNPGKTSTKTIKAKVSDAFNRSKRPAKYADRLLRSVSLPDSGSIDGAADSFEVVMRLDVGYEVLRALKENVDKW